MLKWRRGRRWPLLIARTATRIWEMTFLDLDFDSESLLIWGPSPVLLWDLLVNFLTSMPNRPSKVLADRGFAHGGTICGTVGGTIGGNCNHYFLGPLTLWLEQIFQFGDWFRVAMKISQNFTRKKERQALILIPSFAPTMLSVQLCCCRGAKLGSIVCTADAEIYQQWPHPASTCL